MKKRVKQSLRQKETNNSIRINWHQVRLIIIILLLVLATILIKNSITGKAIDPSNTEDPLGIGLNPDQMQDKVDNPAQTKDEASAYLKKEWGKLFRNENSTFGKYTSPVFKAYDKISPYSDPVFKYTIGVEPGLNWTFILCIAIWITIILNMYTLFSTFSIFSKYGTLAINLGLIIAYSASNINKLIADKIISFVSLAGLWYVQVIIMIIIITIFVLLSTFRGEWELLKKKFNENKEKADIKETLNVLKSKQESQERITKTLTEGLDD